ncbi:MAG: biotin/lipoyl-binding protein [Cellvibrionaceae bacterium]|nr:biotin/lipoyl-binding protein [Cellvibrionaceae bacterium]
MNRLFLGCALIAACALAGCKGGEVDVALGTLERDRVVLTATASEIIAEIAVREGDRVVEGQTLVRLNPLRQEAKVALAQAGVRQVQARLTELQNGVREEEIAAAKARLEGAGAALTAAANQLERVKVLFDQRLVGKAEFDTALAQRDSTRCRAGRGRALAPVAGGHPHRATATGGGASGGGAGDSGVGTAGTGGVVHHRDPRG